MANDNTARRRARAHARAAAADQATRATAQLEELMRLWGVQADATDARAARKRFVATGTSSPLEVMLSAWLITTATGDTLAQRRIMTELQAYFPRNDATHIFAFLRHAAASYRREKFGVVDLKEMKDA
jgi:hypothetical protein